MKKYPELYNDFAHIVKNYLSSLKPVIIDLGAGSGILACALHDFIPSASLIGVDSSYSMLQTAQQNTNNKGCTNFSSVQAQAENLPFANNSVDFVVSRSSIFYWKTPAGGVHEMYRVLRPKGYIIIDSVNPQFPRWRLTFMKILMRFHGAAEPIIHYQEDAFKQAYTKEQVEQFLTESGFTIVDKQGKQRDWKFLIVARKQTNIT